jgi:hypothetical protein
LRRSAAVSSANSAASSLLGGPIVAQPPRLRILDAVFIAFAAA